MKLLKVISVKPDIVMYNTIIDSLGRDKLTSEAYDLYSQMLSEKISPDIITYSSSLMYAFCVIGQWKGAVGLFDEMVLRNVKPDIYTFSILIDSLFKEGKRKEAENVLAMTS